MTEARWYHAMEGWKFRRDEDGNVIIQAPDSMGPGAHQVVTLPGGIWASTVAGVSAKGETGETFRAADELHRGV